MFPYQKIIRDYLKIETPYRGTLVYHGLGSGKTCSSIAVAESLLTTQKVFVLIPASLEKNYREELHESAKEQGIGIVHIYIDGEKGGMTIAYRKSNQFSSGCMVEVAVATCSEADAFSKKIGVQLALEKFFDDNTIELPLLKTYEARDVSYAVKSAFTAMYYSM